MRRVAKFAVDHPRLILAVWVVAFVVALFFVGSARKGVHETDLQIPGTSGAKAAKVSHDRFGGTVSLAIALKGPPELLNFEGPQLVTKLQKIPGVQVLSPWAAGGERRLLEPKGQALLTLQVRRPFEEISDETVPAVKRVLDDNVYLPIKAEMTGLAPLMRALNESSLDSLDKGERIAIPVLLVLLLLVFRSPVAALIPALCGFLITRIGVAAMGGINQAFEIDALALNMVTMIGLALGVDYSLLIVSRFREELAAGRDPKAAVIESVNQAGRTVLFAGAALAAGMLGALAIAPGSLLVSSTMGVIVATALAVLAAMTLIPAALAQLGTGVNAWQFSFGSGENPWVRVAQKALVKPGVAAFFVVLPLLILSLPAAALNTGPPNVANLPPDNPERKSFERFEKLRGGGWAAPYEVTFETKGPITTRGRLKEIERFQRRVARLPDVEAVLGPAELRRQADLLLSLMKLAGKAGRQSQQLVDALKRLTRGQGALNQGLQQSSSGANQLDQGVSQAAGGSSLAAPASQELASGVAQTSAGADDLASGADEADSAAGEIVGPLGDVRDFLVDQNSSSEADLVNPVDSAQSSAQASLRHMADASPAAQADPNFQLAKRELQNSLAQLATLKTNITNLSSGLETNALTAKETAKGFNRLANGIGDIKSGSDELASGVAQTSTGATALSAGISELNSGLIQLSAGSSQLAAGLEEALFGSTAIGRGLTRMLATIQLQQRKIKPKVEQLALSGTDPEKAAKSGYFLLAGAQGTPEQTVENVAFAINLAKGGDTARVMVVPKTGPFAEETAALRPQIEGEAQRTAHQMTANETVGGPAVVLDEFDRSTTARFPYLVLILVAITMLVLLAVFRSPVLAFVAVLLNLLTVGCAVGVMTLLFTGSEPLLGGPGYLDAIALSGIFAIIFGLSIDYEVFLISRLLEGRRLTGTTDGAIKYGLEKTATIITGAAAIMAGVFIAFAISPVGNTRQFGVGLTVAVLLDATVIRLILLPALIKLFGERTWHVPKWLRKLPDFSSGH